MIVQAENTLQFRPRLVIAYADSAHASQSSRAFRRLGWEVHLASSAQEACRLARLLGPSVVLLDVELRSESGWLTCARLREEQPQLTVVLLASEVTPQVLEHARRAGAAEVIARTAAIPELVGEVHQRVLAHT